ncbi:RNA-binding protein [Effusibacillus lacus]|uniref:RNA-binding protein S4 n=1 Tax=Effusibacillus lacus TaxID=1348429 RepID=A0A292YQ03_9BACL|nr:YlmH/Sll1252 family protein [Effusibacillus lacus]TCS75668.1 RNA-binding protein YlmH [Effusibacillus lacus]GAX90989.1 RNA-binding protein S4 [Effusibacillus lacus]
MSDNWLMHYRPEEKPFVQRMIELVHRASSRHSPVLTPFLDPRQVRIAENIARTVGGVVVFADGGWEGAERKRVLLAPDYWTPEPSEFELDWMRLEIPGEYLTLKHGDYLGALTGLGLKREKIGDLSVMEDGCDLVAAADVADYIRLHLNKAGRASVLVRQISREEYRRPVIHFSEREFTVMSLRVDAVTAEGFQLARGKILDPIKSGKLQLNWQTVTDPSLQVEEGDVISLRGMGRLKIMEIGGLTKKGRTLVRIGKYL